MTDGPFIRSAAVAKLSRSNLDKSSSPDSFHGTAMNCLLRLVFQTQPRSVISLLSPQKIQAPEGRKTKPIFRRPYRGSSNLPGKPTADAVGYCLSPLRGSRYFMTS